MHSYEADKRGRPNWPQSQFEPISDSSLFVPNVSKESRSVDWKSVIVSQIGSLKNAHVAALSSFARDYDGIGDPTQVRVLIDKTKPLIEKFLKDPISVNETEIKNLAIGLTTSLNAKGKELSEKYDRSSQSSELITSIFHAGALLRMLCAAFVFVSLPTEGKEEFLKITGVSVEKWISSNIGSLPAELTELMSTLS